LHDLYNRYGDWYLALAAYNCGPGVIDRGVERTGYADFWQLCRRGMLPRETARYVPIILAMTIMAKNPREYGLAGIDSDPALEYDTLRISAPTHLQLIADLTETPVSQIRELNPSLLKSVAPPGTSLRVGRGAGDALAAALEKIPPERRTVWRAHRVLDGETLGAIARRYRVAERGIAAANPKLLGGLAAGDLLIIPALASRDQPLVRPAVQRRGSHRVAARAARSPRHRAAARRAAVSSAASLTHIAARRTAASSLKR
jgi:membrane-bound lytic murein transglycosylase D